MNDVGWNVWSLNANDWTKVGAFRDDDGRPRSMSKDEAIKLAADMIEPSINDLFRDHL